MSQTASRDLIHTPAKVARLVLAVAELDDPPLRSLAGSNAYEYGREAWHVRVETDARWEQAQPLNRSRRRGRHLASEARRQPPRHSRLTEPDRAKT